MKLSILGLAFILVLGFLASVLVTWYYPTHTPFTPHNDRWNGISRFTTELGADIISIKELAKRREDTTAVLVLARSIADQDWLALASYVQEGGTLILMDSSKEAEGNRLFLELGLESRVEGTPLLEGLPSKSPFPNIRAKDFPVATNGPKAQFDAKAVVLNRPTAILKVDPSQAVLQSSRYSFLDSNLNTLPDEEEPRGPFTVATAFAVGDGSLTVVADTSLVTNAGMGLGDNMAFLRQILEPTAGQSRIAVISEGLPLTPADRAKLLEAPLVEGMRSPWAQIALVAAILSILFAPLWRSKRGVIHGSELS